MLTTVFIIVEKKLQSFRKAITQRPIKIVDVPAALVIQGNYTNKLQYDNSANQINVFPKMQPLSLTDEQTAFGYQCVKTCFHYIHFLYFLKRKRAAGELLAG